MRSRCLGVGLLAAVLMAAPLLAQNRATYEQLTVADSAVGIAATTLRPSGGPQMNHCRARLATAQIRYRFDGTAPDATTGTIVDVGDVVEIDNHAHAAAIRFIRTGGTSGALSISCWE